MLTWGVRLDHWWAPGESERMASRVANVLVRPCFADAALAYCWRRDWESTPPVEKSVETIRASLRDPRTDILNLRDQDHWPETSRIRICAGAVRYNSVPLQSNVAVPLPDVREELEAATCDLACALLASVGAVSVFEKLDQAGDFGCEINAEKAQAMKLSSRRRHEWLLWGTNNVHVDTEIAGPEWALFLSSGHLARLPLTTLRKSGAFAEVRDLPGNRAYLRLTDDPRDALSPDYESHLDRAREALRPILADLSRVDWLYRRAPQ